MRATEARATPSAVGVLLQHWRKTRQLSQLALATEAEISARHLSFLETGRARPSREMVLLLASALEVPLRERNSLLLAAGFAPLYQESKLDAPALAPVRAALDAILAQQEPHPAVVMNRQWDILMTNAAASRFFGHLLGGAAASAPANVVRLMFSLQGLRPYVRDWEVVAEALIHRVHREAVGHVVDHATAALLREVLAYPGVPARWGTPALAPPQLPIIPITFDKGAETFRYFSTVTTLGTPQDITAQEIRIECFFPLR
jgi:transcriptional regulator with XRE-family HTH domain